VRRFALKPLRALLASAAVAAAVCACAAAAGTGSKPAAVPAAAGDTVIMVVRHAEKSAPEPPPADPKDPPLTAAGRVRAEALADMLAGAGVSAILSTPFRRNLETAAPLAQRTCVVITRYDADVAASALAAQILADYRGRTIALIGHSNTIPDLVAALSHQAVAPIADDDYSRLYVISIDAAGKARLLTLGFPRSAGSGE
jgi:broad specificity phosphatase PhoE